MSVEDAARVRIDALLSQVPANVTEEDRKKYANITQEVMKLAEIAEGESKYIWTELEVAPHRTEAKIT